MTILQGGQHHSSSLRGKALISSKPREKVQATMQRKVSQVSDLEPELHKKQTKTSEQKLPSAAVKRYNLLTEEHDNPHVRYGQKIKRQRYIEKSECSAGESSRLLMLAELSELLLETEHNFHHPEINNQDHEGISKRKEVWFPKPLEVNDQELQCISEEDHVTTHQPVQLTNESDERREQLAVAHQLTLLGSATRHNSESEKYLSDSAKEQVHVIESQRALRSEVQQDLGSIEKSPRRKQPCFAGPLQVMDRGLLRPSADVHMPVHLPVQITNELDEIGGQQELKMNDQVLQQSSVGDHMLAYLPVQMTDKPVKVRGQQEVTRQLTCTEMRLDPSSKRYLSDPAKGQVCAPMKDQTVPMSFTEFKMVFRNQMQEKYRFIACQRRMMRMKKNERRKTCLPEAKRVLRSDVQQGHQSIEKAVQMTTEPTELRGLQEVAQVDDQGLHQLSEEHQVPTPTHLPVQMTNEFAELGVGRQEVPNQLTLLRTVTRSDSSSKEYLCSSVQELVLALMKEQSGETPASEQQMLLGSELQKKCQSIARQRRKLKMKEKRKTPVIVTEPQIVLPVTEPQMLLRSEMQQEHRSIARQRRMLRIYKQRKQRTLVQMKQMCGDEQTLLFQNGYMDQVNQKQLFCNLQRQQKCITALLRRASKKVESHLRSSQSREHIEELNGNHVDTREVQKQYESLEQHHEQGTVHVAQGQTSRVKGQTHFSQIKCEARSKHASS